MLEYGYLSCKLQLPNLPLFTLKVVLLLPCIGSLYITLMYRCLVHSAPSKQIFPKERSAWLVQTRASLPLAQGPHSDWKRDRLAERLGRVSFGAAAG